MCQHYYFSIAINNIMLYPPCEGAGRGHPPPERGSALRLDDEQANTPPEGGVNT